MNFNDLFLAFSNVKLWLFLGTRTPTRTPTHTDTSIISNNQHFSSESSEFHQHYTDLTAQEEKKTSKKTPTKLSYIILVHFDVISGWNWQGRQGAPYSKQQRVDFCSVGIFPYWNHDGDLVMVSETPRRVWNNSPESHLQIKLTNVM